MKSTFTTLFAGLVIACIILVLLFGDDCHIHLPR